MSFYHNIKKYHKSTWRISDTAKYFNISIGQASENIQLCEAIKLDNHLEELSRNSALKSIRSNNHASL